MEIIDAHQHFWHFDPVRDSWITDEMNAIQKDFLPADLLLVLRENNVEGCIAVQASQSEEETNFLISLANETPFIKGVIGWVDLQESDIDERLVHFSQFPKLKGFRHVLQGESNRKLMLEKAFTNGIEKLSKYGFTYDILVYTDQLDYTLEFVKQFPNQKFVIDHMAKPQIKEQKMGNWPKQIQSLGECENVWCKISGMVTEADWKNWKYEDFVPYLDIVFESFGGDKVMFGSDWPVCNVAGGYKAMKSIPEQYINKFSQSWQKKFWSENAKDFYNINDQ